MSLQGGFTKFSLNETRVGGFEGHVFHGRLPVQCCEILRVFFLSITSLCLGSSHASFSTFNVDGKY